MHELAVTESILNIVVKHAAASQAQKVLSISLKIGEFTDLIGDWMQHYFDYLSRDTIADGAVLNIERAPVVFQCKECKISFPVSVRDSGKIGCTQCGSTNVMLISGREFYIQHIEVI